MPKFRSITMSINSQWETKKFPEFAHPDSAQFRYRGSTPSVDSTEARRPVSISTSSTSASRADSRSDKDPSVSCYIPSIPGMRFFVKYTIEPPHPEGQLFYFKLFMNGRHISSWGVNPITNQRGQVLRGLFATDDSDESQTSLRHGGIESRPFLFAPAVDGKSAADDGGLIEIRIFRARGRKRRAPNLEQFRPQDQYGISLPSAGLVDKPQETRYYDYILVDPKDEPYAAFLFHYRSWEQLQSLQLIPASHPRSLLKPSNSFAFLAGPSRAEGLQDVGGADSLNDGDGAESPVKLQSSPCIINDSELRNSNEFGLACDRHGQTGEHEEAIQSSSLSIEEKGSSSATPISTFAVPQATLDEWAYDRPLPRLPKAKSSFDHFRKSSTSSNAPSITPSLLPWCDRDSNNLSPEPIIGVAAVVPVLGTSPPPDDSTLEDDSFCSSTDYSIETPSQLLQAPIITSNTLIIPPEALLLPPSVTIRKSRRQNSLSTIVQDRLIIKDSNEEDNGPEDPFGSASPAPSEAEWLSRQQSISSIKRDAGQNGISKRHGLSRADTRDNNISFENLKKKRMGWGGNRSLDQPIEESEDEDLASPISPRIHDKDPYRTHNWI